MQRTQFTKGSIMRTLLWNISVQVPLSSLILIEQTNMLIYEQPASYILCGRNRNIYGMLRLFNLFLLDLQIHVHCGD